MAAAAGLGNLVAVPLLGAAALMPFAGLALALLGLGPEDRPGRAGAAALALNGLWVALLLWLLVAACLGRPASAWPGGAGQHQPGQPPPGFVPRYDSSW